MNHRAQNLPDCWPTRRVSPDMARNLREAEFHSPDCGFPFGIDRLPEAFDADEPAPLGRRLNFKTWATGAVIAVASLCAAYQVFYA